MCSTIYGATSTGVASSLVSSKAIVDSFSETFSRATEVFSTLGLEMPTSVSLDISIASSFSANTKSSILSLSIVFLSGISVCITESVETSSVRVSDIEGSVSSDVSSNVNLARESKFSTPISTFTTSSMTSSDVSTGCLSGVTILTDSTVSINGTALSSSLSFSRTCSAISSDGTSNSTTCSISGEVGFMCGASIISGSTCVDRSFCPSTTSSTLNVSFSGTTVVSTG